MFRRLIRRQPALQASAKPSIWTKDKIELSKYSIGDWTYGCPHVKDWGQGTQLKIGNYCSIADNVVILLGGEHRIDWISTFPFFELLNVLSEKHKVGFSKGDVVIGHDVWIGINAVILSGVTIGSGAVVGAGSVVAKSVEPYSIVAGNPARHIKFRIPEHHIPKMLAIKWWEWPHERVLEAVPLLMSSQIDEFIRRYGNQ